METNGARMRVHAIYTYPIKSLRGCTSRSLKATPAGFEYDRRFMLRRELDDENMHVSGFPEMCLFTTELINLSNCPPASRTGEDDDEDDSSLNASNASESDTEGYDGNEEEPDTIIVRYGKNHVFDKPDIKLDDSEPELRVPLKPDVKDLRLREVPVAMHNSNAIGFDMGEQYNSWFSLRFGYAVRLLYVGENQRKVLGTLAPDHPVHDTRNVDRQQNANTMSSPPHSASNSGWYDSLANLTSNLVNAVVPRGSPAGMTSLPNTTDPSYGTVNDTKAIDEGITFADCAPFLIISRRSWQNASDRLGLPPGQEMDISKFRANIVVDGEIEDFEEDFWRELWFEKHDPDYGSDDEHEAEKSSKAARIVLTGNCARCSSLNVDYETGKPGLGEAGLMLKRLQKDRRVDSGTKYSPVFGRYGFLAHPSGKHPGSNASRSDIKVSISVGDHVTIARRNEERTRFQWPGLSTDK